MYVDGPCFRSAVGFNKKGATPRRAIAPLGHGMLPRVPHPTARPGAGRSGTADRRSVGLIAQECRDRSEEHTSELQSLMRISYAVFCLKKKKHIKNEKQNVTIVETLVYDRN